VQALVDEADEEVVGPNAAPRPHGAQARARWKHGLVADNVHRLELLPQRGCGGRRVALRERRTCFCLAHIIRSWRLRAAVPAPAAVVAASLVAVGVATSAPTSSAAAATAFVAVAPVPLKDVGVRLIPTSSALMARHGSCSHAPWERRTSAHDQLLVQHSRTKRKEGNGGNKSHFTVLTMISKKCEGRRKNSDNLKMKGRKKLRVCDRLV
jgi:hypothetical protein